MYFSRFRLHSLVYFYENTRPNFTTRLYKLQRDFCVDCVLAVIAASSTGVILVIVCVIVICATRSGAEGAEGAGDTDVTKLTSKHSNQSMGGSQSKGRFKSVSQRTGSSASPSRGYSGDFPSSPRGYSQHSAQRDYSQSLVGSPRGNTVSFPDAPHEFSKEYSPPYGPSGSYAAMMSRGPSDSFQASTGAASGAVSSQDPSAGTFLTDYFVGDSSAAVSNTTTGTAQASRSTTIRGTPAPRDPSGDYLPQYAATDSFAPISRDVSLVSNRHV